MTNKAGEQPTITLLPCPFCGGEAVSVIGMREHKDFGVRCGVAKCYASIGCHGETQKQAAEKWNTRTASLAAQDGLVEALELAFDFAVKVDALLTPLKSEWQDVNMWTEYDEGVYQMRPKVTLAVQAALSAIKGDKS